jgi:hypothetical protein
MVSVPSSAGRMAALQLAHLALTVASAGDWYRLAAQRNGSTAQPSSPASLPPVQGAAYASGRRGATPLLHQHCAEPDHLPAALIGAYLSPSNGGDDNAVRDFSGRSRRYG